MARDTCWNPDAVLTRLGRAIARHPLPVVLTWAVLVVAGFLAATGVVGEGLFARLGGGEPDVPGEANVGRELLTQARPTGDSLQLVLAGVDPGAEDLAATVGAARADLAAIENVASVSDPYAFPDPAAPDPTDPRALAFVSTDVEKVLVTVSLAPHLGDRATDEALDSVRERLIVLGEEVRAGDPGATSAVGGAREIRDAINEQVKEDLLVGEGIALPVSLLVMVFVFGGFLAAGMPILGAVASIAGGLAALLGFSHVIDLDATVVNVVTVMGLGLCIDYGLLMVSRFREELRAVVAREATTLGGTRAERRRRSQRVPYRQRSEALVTTLTTAGRTVLFSGVTVAISLGGLLMFQAPVLAGTGAAGMSVVVVALLVALTLVPALMVLGATQLIRPGALNRVRGLRAVVARMGDVAPDVGFFSRLATRVQRRPWWVVLGVVLLLVTLALPALSLRLRSSGVDLLAVDHPQRQFFDDLRADFPATASPAVTVVARGGSPEVGAELARWSAEVAEIEGVRSVDPPQVLGDLTVVGVRLESQDVGGQQAASVVRELRDNRPEVRTWVTGQAAGLVDFSSSLADTAPKAIGLVVLATFVLLFLMTGSLLIPLKALLLNTISLGASIGVVVWGFQDGHLAGLLDFTAPDGIETVIPPIVLALGFGLAMDYEVFLLSRIKEMRDKGLDNDASVVAGLQKSGRIITSAALIIVVVFSGFVAGELLVIKETGVALAVAVAIDATLVRMLLVPATMTLLGDWNWWAPRPLRLLHDRIGVSH